MGKKGILQRKRLAAVFASFSILIMGATSLLKSMSLDYYTVLSTLEKVMPATIALGGLGWLMGMILDRPKKINKTGYNNLFLNEFMKNNLTEAGASSGENT